MTGEIVGAVAVAGSAYKLWEFKSQEAASKKRCNKLQSIGGPCVVVVGCGVSGILAGIKLQKAGIPFLIIEKENEIGGTWLLNQYPGCACDVPAHLYSFSFCPKTDWTTPFAPQAEILEYLQSVVEKYKLRKHIRLNCQMINATWRENESMWEIVCSDQTRLTVPFYIGAVGALHHPNYPPIDKTRFKGEQFHSAEWNPSWKSNGRRVAVVGSAASAVQLVPEIALDAEQVFVFQRTPNWIAPRVVPFVLPMEKYPDWLKTMFEYVPLLAKAHRLGIYIFQESFFWPLGIFDAGSKGARSTAAALTKNMEMQCQGNKKLAQKIIPKYAPGCKRICRVDKYIPALLRENVELVTSGVAELEESSVIDCEGNLYEVDTIIYATGFKVGSLGVNSSIHGANGICVSGDDLAENAQEAFLGIVSPGFPNSFMLLGPNTALGHNSVILMIESQVEYIIRMLTEAIDSDISRMEIRPQVVEEYYEWLWKEFDLRVWTHGGCSSWYQNKQGKIFSLWPSRTWNYFYTVATAPGILESYHVQSKL